ncbi:hypothetical protein ABE202_17735 [Bacillus subtilis]|uniref:hypothetical protein n=1 Tax=Bacillus subtilis TaxID=1423 RepID=UPI0022816A7A|nr:hypothetical protein [Bacillus subtilis]MCY8930461.1 hypothetical protein [Bacillus subtilis]
MDYSVLREKIIEEHDKVLFDESISCYKGNALRAAYITNWINIAESLKFKFYNMASRDHEINKKVISKIEDLEEKERPTDSLLIRAADEFGLITKEQKLKLEHIKTMRGVYAHPLSKAPTKSEVELAIEFGVDIVLSQSALLKHAFVKDLVVSIFEKHHYLDDNEEKVRKAAESTLNHINPKVYPYFFKLLVQDLDRVSGDLPKVIFLKRGQIFLESLLQESIDKFSSFEWKLVELLHKYPEIVSNLFIQENFWPKIEEEIQDSIMGYLIEPVKDKKVKIPSEESIKKVLNLYHLKMLTERHIERLKAAIDKCSLYKRMLAGVPLDWYKNDLIIDLKSSNWYSQNPVIDVIESIGPNNINSLESSFLLDLGRNVLQAADGGARRAEDFVTSLFKSDEEWSPYFIEGIFLETFINHKKRLRFKKYFRSGLKAVLALRKEERELIIQNAIKLLEEATPKGWIREKTFNEYITLLEEGIEKTNNGGRKKIFSKLRDAMVETKDRILEDEEE